MNWLMPFRSPPPAMLLSSPTYSPHSTKRSFYNIHIIKMLLPPPPSPCPKSFWINTTHRASKVLQGDLHNSPPVSPNSLQLGMLGQTKVLANIRMPQVFSYIHVLRQKILICSPLLVFTLPFPQLSCSPRSKAPSNVHFEDQLPD